MNPAKYQLTKKHWRMFSCMEFSAEIWLKRTFSYVQQASCIFTVVFTLNVIFLFYGKKTSAYKEGLSVFFKLIKSDLTRLSAISPVWTWYKRQRLSLWACALLHRIVLATSLLVARFDGTPQWEPASFDALQPKLTSQREVKTIIRSVKSRFKHKQYNINVPLNFKNPLTLLHLYFCLCKVAMRLAWHTFWQLC